MAWYMKDPTAFKALVEERSVDRELGRLKHADFAKAAGVTDSTASSVINGSKGCGREVAQRIADRLGFPYVPSARLFEER